MIEETLIVEAHMNGQTSIHLNWDEAFAVRMVESFPYINLFFVTLSTDIPTAPEDGEMRPYPVYKS